MRLVAVGDNITDCYPAAGQMFPGGNCVNVAVHAARTGAKSSYIGAIGRDERGAQLRDALDAEGVDATRLRVLDGPTGYATVLHRDGERSFGAYDRGVAPFALDDADLDFIAEHDVAHSSYAAGLDQQLADIADRVPLSFDFDAHAGDDYARLVIPHVTYAFFSASHLTVPATEDLLHWACDESGVRVALATRGSAGAMLYDGDDLVVQPAIPVDTVDTLGAGDAYIANVLAGLWADLPTAETLRRAAEEAASVCTRLGAFGYPLALSGTRPQQLTTPLKE
ncbi:PfkB family carbohydrate kinase [Ornithinimicrobium cavernae]|uniref:PfkB family carbohydrate kinase n=1 Tax=Ornithinimicrobium cavernae TaxID=2666047 RepID=UPI000D68D784|nr:PfkB family carbohydrate kinase [Ornithinimicrobium cavernae]